MSALAAFVLIGAIDAAYGPLLGIVSGRFGVSLAEAGTLISIHFCGAFAGVAMLLAARTRVSGRLVAFASLGALGAGCLLIASAHAWPALAAGAFGVGLGFGATDFGLNDLAARTEHRGRAGRLTALNAAFGAGAIAGPALVSLLGSATLRAGFACAAAVAGGAAVGMRGLRAPASRPWRATTSDPEPVRPEPDGRSAGKQRGSTPTVARAAGPARLRARRAPGRVPGTGGWRIAPLFGMAYLCYVGCESGIAGWIPANLSGLGYSPHLASAITSAFWGALTVGRLSLIPVSRAAAPRRIVLAAAPALLGCVALAAIPALAPVAFAAAGLAAAPIFPVGLAWAAGAAPGDQRPTVWALTCSMIGGVLGPGAIAAMVATTSVRAVSPVLAALAAATGAAFLAVPTGRRRSASPAAPRSGAEG